MGLSVSIANNGGRYFQGQAKVNIEIIKSKTFSFEKPSENQKESDRKTGLVLYYLQFKNGRNNSIYKLGKGGILR